MPWVVEKRGSKWAVYKQGSDGQPVGDALGTHDTEAEARQQQKALYASESTKAIAVKAVEGSEDEIEGYGMPFGGPFNGSDVQGERFSAKTDFAFDWFSERPLIYQHGLDAPGTSVVGRVKAWESQDDGVWVKAQLDRSNKYFAAIKRLIEQGGLYFSSGSMNHLAKVEKSGEITRWPWIELSLTPTPANPTATLDFATAKAHLKAAGLDLPDEDALKAKLDAAALKAISFEDVRREVGALLDKRMVMAGPLAMDRPMPCAYVEETYSDHVIASVHGDGGERFYSVTYTLGPDGHVASIGEATEVEETYTPMSSKAVDGLSIADQAAITASHAATLVERTKDLRERRTKEGRIISGLNRTRIKECLDAMDGAMTALRDLYDSTQPPAKAGDVRRRVQAQMQALRLRALSLS